MMNEFVVLLLCIVAAVATVVLLPGRREVAIGRIGGILLVVCGLIFLTMLVAKSSGGDRVYFWIFTAIALTAAVRVVTHAKPVYSALYFVLTVFASAGLFVLLEAEFMAAALVIIYAGAILVTYVFVIMLASQATIAGEGTPAMPIAGYDSHSREPAVAAAIGFMLMGLLLVVILDRADETITPAGPVTLLIENHPVPAVIPVQGATQELGMFLFRNQSIQLELAGVILALSMVGAIVISKRQVYQLTSTKAVVIDRVEGPNTPVDDNPHSIPVDGKEPRRARMMSGV